MVATVDEPSKNADAKPMLSGTDLQVLRVLIHQQGRIISRDTIQRMAEFDSVSARRVDASIVVLRRHLGPDAVLTVRRRGWMLAESSLESATDLLSHQRKPLG